MSYLFTSESVSEGHPDKMCDQISDAVLDAIFEQDPNARVACETAIKTGFVLLLGAALAFLRVLEGGLRVLYLEGDLRWEQKFLRRGLDAGPVTALHHGAAGPGGIAVVSPFRRP